MEEGLVGEAAVVGSSLIKVGTQGAQGRKGLGCQFEVKKGQSIMVKAVLRE